MNETHLDIFSGIGGFALAAREAGFETVAFCESDSRCREFLGKTWGLPVEPDIRKLDGRKFAGISLLTGGPPCQPASRAGKQGGSGDDRWLWGEALRVLEEAKPSAVVFENPPGILDVGIDGILSKMGRLGYETQLFDIPACAVDSPQLRHRIWFIGFLAHPGHDARRSEYREQLHDDNRGSRQSVEVGPLADTAGTRSNGEAGQEQHFLRRPLLPARSSDSERTAWQNSIWVPCADGKLRRAPDDSFSLVDGLHRSILGALGNSIVLQVAVEILKAVKISLQE